MAPWDPGLQPERTELAWRRTILAATTGLAIAGRYAGEGQPVLALALPATAVILGLAALRLVAQRMRAIDQTLRADASTAQANDAPLADAHTAAADPTAENSGSHGASAPRSMPGGGMLMATAGAAATALLAAAWYVVSAAL